MTEEKDLTALVLYMEGFKRDYYEPIKRAAEKCTLTTKNQEQYDKELSIKKKEIFLRGMIENIEYLIEKRENEKQR